MFFFSAPCYLTALRHVRIDEELDVKRLSTHTHTHTRFLSGSVGCGYLSAVLIGASLVPGNGMAHLSLPEKDPRILVRNTFSHITTRTIAFSQEHLVKDLWCLTFSPRTQGFPYLSPVFQQFYNRCFHTKKKEKEKTPEETGINH